MPDTLKLDARQRAMLAEMGVRVWAPEPSQAAPNAAIPVMPPPAAPAVSPAVSPAMATPSDAAAPAARRSRAPASVAQASTLRWRLDAPRPLYPAADDAPPARTWLIALDSPTPDDPGRGEAGALLHNMLRAMGLKDAPQVYVSTVRRARAGDADDAAALAQVLESLQPVVVLALGPSAARCVLGGHEPLEQQRTREHRLATGTPVVVSYAPAFLVNKPQAKREAWADLQRAMALAQAPGAMP